MFKFTLRIIVFCTIFIGWTVHYCQAQEDIINACINTAYGAIRIIDDTQQCNTAWEYKVSWSLAGARAATVDSQDTKTIVSSNVDFSSQPNLVSAITVPEDKAFVLTDIIVSPCENMPSQEFSFAVLENSTVKFSSKVQFVNGTLEQIHLNSGIRFSPGSVVNLVRKKYFASVLLSGYLHSPQ